MPTPLKHPFSLPIYGNRFKLHRWPSSSSASLNSSLISLDANPSQTSILFAPLWKSFQAPQLAIIFFTISKFISLLHLFLSRYITFSLYKLIPIPNSFNFDPFSWLPLGPQFLIVSTSFLIQTPSNPNKITWMSKQKKSLNLSMCLEDAMMVLRQGWLAAEGAFSAMGFMMNSDFEILFLGNEA